MAQDRLPQGNQDLADSNVGEPAEDDALRKRLLSRIAVAGVVIVGLLGGLAVFDSLNKPQAPALPKMAAVPEAPSNVREEKQAESKPVEDEKVSSTEKTEEKEKPAAVAAVPERTDTPLAPLPVDKPLKPAKPVTPPATAKPAVVRPSPPAAAPIRSDPRREIAKAMPEPAAPVHAPASRPLSQATETVRRFLLQVGVFSNHANAEELVAKLQQAGIPAQIESRVQVGPFASRAEADIARTKLRALGIDDGILVRR